LRPSAAGLIGSLSKAEESSIRTVVEIEFALGFAKPQFRAASSPKSNSTQVKVSPRTAKTRTVDAAG